jgi:hypothetical protein
MNGQLPEQLQQTRASGMDAAYRQRCSIATVSKSLRNGKKR